MNHRSVLMLSGFGLFLFTACGGSGGGGGGGLPGTSGSDMTIVEASNGFGKLLPHTITALDAGGNPTGGVVEIRTLKDLKENARQTNPIHPTPQWAAGAVLPTGQPGNHFIYARFSQKLAIDSILESSQSAAVDNNLTGNIQVVQVNPFSGQTIPVSGRAFIDGMTYGSQELDPTGNPTGQLLLEEWVSVDGSGNATATDPRGVGFPGTEGGFSGTTLINESTFVFVVDSDGDLSTYETFPTGFQIQMKMGEGVASKNGRRLGDEGVASSTVGSDSISPEVLISGAAQSPVIIPGNGELGVDPETTIEVTFTEPVQVLTIGDLDTGTPPTVSAAIQIQFGPATGKVDVPFFVEPFSVFDLSRLKLIPLYAFPGSGPQLPGGITCGDLAQVDIIVNTAQFQDLTTNLNTQSPSTFFVTGEGPGLVNAPVTPDAVYIGRGGSQQGISVIDLNGFGQGCGNPTYDIQEPIKKGNTNFPNNPNVNIQGSLLIPPLAPGSCTIDGGSPGVFSLVKDSSLNDIVATFPLIESVGDMALGQALDTAFNNSQPFGCQAGGGNICAQTALKNTAILTDGLGTYLPTNTAPPGLAFPLVQTVFGTQNIASFAPHPNPPALVFPPTCTSPLIAGQEPTSIDTVFKVFLSNLLGPNANSQGIPALGIPPEGLLARGINQFFEGPSPQQPLLQLCLPFVVRQQVGQFLYVIDRVASEVVVLNSNRFTVLDRIRLTDPTSFAMSPNLDFLAVTNQGADQVSFIDVDPASSSFHQIVKTTVVGNGPTGIAWTPDNEDILVCNTGDSTISVLSVFTFGVRKVLRNQLRAPFDLAITPRQQARGSTPIGLFRNVYYAYIMNSDGSVPIFESGPDGINGWGFDDVIGSLPFTFTNPKAIQPDATTLNSRFWIAHENQLGPDGLPTGLQGGAVSLCGIVGGTIGQIPLDLSGGVSPQIRDINYGVVVSVGSNELTGIPVDIAFDNLNNAAAVPNIDSPIFGAGTPRRVNGKSVLKVYPVNNMKPATTAQFLFLAVPNSSEGPGVIDVISLRAGFTRFDTNPFDPGVQSIPASNAQIVVDYYRQ